jgi:HAE1 family hydrophobic/amphiphilic exporter-1
VIPPPIQGIGNASGFTMQVELRDGSFDYAKLQALVQTMVHDGNTQTELQRLNSTFRAGVPQLRVTVDRVKAETLRVAVGDVFNVLAGYVGASYVNQFNKFGRTFQVYVQADSRFRLLPHDIENLYVRSQDNKMVPLGTLVQISPMVGPSLVGLYNLYPTASIVGGPAAGFSSGEAMNLMEEIADKTLPRGAGFEWTAMSYQEKIVGNQIIYVFGLGMLLVYLCLAGQYESWIAPISVILAVPLSLLGPVIALTSLGLSNNLYTQIGLVLLIALSAKNAILIVEVARERRMLQNVSIVQAAVDAARVRFRPILMTSFAFILGVVPLVTATGAGASARVSLGLAVFSGMIASTCLAVLFVPSFFVVMQRFEEWRKSRKQQAPAHTAA